MTDNGEAQVMMADRARVSRTTPEATMTTVTGALPEAQRFPEALRAAISARGLSLDRIQHRLEMRGIRLSVATLSYWQYGRRRPERPESLQALRYLETVLQVAPAELCSLLGPPRPRGRRSRTLQPASLADLWRPHSHAPEQLAAVDASADTVLSTLSHHDNCEVDEYGRLCSLHASQVLRAEAEGADRWVLVYDWAGSATEGPSLRGLRNCRLGRVARHPGSTLLVAELLFERPLRRGETVIIDYQLHGRRVAAMPASGSHSRRSRMPVREYVFQVHFRHGVVPQRCFRFIRPAAGERAPRPVKLLPSHAGEVHTIGLDLAPGEFGIGWSA